MPKKSAKLAAVVSPVAPLRLDFGCGHNKREGFIGVDCLPFDGKVDIVLDLAAKSPDLPSCSPGHLHIWHGPDAGCRNCGIPFRKDYGWKAWPWENDSVDEAHSSHFIEHLTGPERIHFFNELYRVLKPRMQCQIIVPHWSSGRAYGDLTHQWPPVVEMFWFYLNKDWRTQNAPHVPLTCDFDAVWGHSLAQPWVSRNQESQAFAINHYREVAQDMICTLTKK